MSKIKIPSSMQTRAQLKTKTFNKKERTIDVVWSTGARVKRSSWFGPSYYEELSMDPAHVDLSRLNGGANVLNNHSQYDLKDIIGVVERASIENGEGIATIRFSDRPELEGIVRDIENGIIRNISVGYKVDKYKKIKEKSKRDDEEDEEKSTPIYRAVSWQPMEISFVCVPADAKSQSRNQDNESYEVEVDDVINNEGESMKKRSGVKAEKEEIVSSDADISTDSSEKGEETASGSSESKPEDEGKEKEADEKREDAKVPTSNDGDKPEGQRSEAAIRKEENLRRKGIISAVRLAGLGDDFAESLVDDVDMTLDKARAAIFTKLESSQPETRNNKIEVRDMENKDLRRQATVRGILNRYDAKAFPLKEGDNEYRQDSLIMTARHYLSKECNESRAFEMSPAEVAKRALHHTSDFPLLLGDVANASLRQGYEGLPSTYQPFVKEVTATNFKDINSYQVSKGGMLRKVNEHGEYERGSLVESADKYRVEKFGLIIGKTWELMVNDDLGAFTSIAQNLGQRAREMENKMFWEMIRSNPIMADGFRLFSVEHGNLGVAAAIGVESVSAGRLGMSKMKDLDGELIRMSPSYLVAPSELELTLEQFLAPLTPVVGSEINPFRNKLQGLAEPYLSEDGATVQPWYLFSDKNKTAMAELARLDGRGPEIFTREGFDIDGQEVKIRYVFGMKVIDYRGFYKNPGVAL